MIATAQADQVTAFTLVPACVRCGNQGLTRIPDGRYRCQGCYRWVTSIEYAPTVLIGRPGMPPRRVP